jgi:hypothetical protein
MQHLVICYDKFKYNFHRGVTMSSLLLVSGANAQSTLAIMRMMDGNGNNKTDSSQLIGGIDGMDSSDPNEVNDNAQPYMSMLPFKTGVLAMPMTPITPAEILQSVSGMFSGDDADASTDGNATE